MTSEEKYAMCAFNTDKISCDFKDSTIKELGPNNVSKEVQPKKFSTAKTLFVSALIQNTIRFIPVFLVSFKYLLFSNKIFKVLIEHSKRVMTAKKVNLLTSIKVDNAYMSVRLFINKRRLFKNVKMVSSM